MTNATWTPSRHPYRPVTQLRLGRILGFAAVVLLLIVGGAAWLLHSKTRQVVAAATDTTTWPAWLKQTQSYPPPEPLLPPATPIKPPDQTAAHLAAIQRQIDEIKQALNKRPTPPPAPPPTSAPAAAPPQKKPAASMLYIAHEIKDTKTDTTRPTYTLAPGSTKIPCLIETQMQSEIAGVFTAKISTNVYDTKTGRHLLIPQGSTMLGRYDSDRLLYGNTRIPTVSILVSLPDARTIDLGEAPVTDNLGVQGLTGKVDQRFWELAKAVFIGGVLRAGAQVAQTTVAQSGPAGQVASSLASEGSQQGQARVRALDTRPRITVFAGQVCSVILTQPLQLPAFYE